VADWTDGDLALLRVLSSEITRGEKRAAEVFAPPPVTADEVKASAAVALDAEWGLTPEGGGAR
jgi:hypothetical protein